MPEFIIGGKNKRQKPPFYTPILPSASPLVSRLRAAYVFNEFGGFIANDAAIGANHATIVGPGGWNTSPPTLLGPTVNFDGNTYVQSPQTIYLAGPGHSVSCRMVYSGSIPLAANNWLWALFSPGPSLRSFVEVTNSNSLSFGYAGSVTTGQPVSAGTLYDVVCTTDGATQSVYINGLLATSRANTNPVSAGFYALWVGSRNLKDASNNNWGGWIDAVYLWDRALTAAEVGTLHLAPFAAIPSTDGLRKFWPGNAVRTVASATALALAGPTVGGIGNTSPPFTVTTLPTYGAITGSCTITPNDGGAGGTFSPTSVTVTTSLPYATFFYVPFAGPSAVISITNDKGLTNPSSITMSIPAYVPPAGTIPMTDVNLNFSPGTWRSAGGTPPAFVTNNPGAYLEWAIDGAFNLAVQYDTSAQVAAGVPASEYPVVGLVCDNAPMQAFQLNASTNIQAILSSQSNARHYVRLYHLRSSQAIDRWGTNSTDPASQLKLVNLLVTVGATTVVWPLKQNKILYIFGTSITEGVQTENAGSTLFANNAQWAWSAIVGDALGCEWGQIGFGGSSIQQPNSNNIPPMYTCNSSTYASGSSHDSTIPTNQAWTRFDQQHSRLSAGKFAVMPDIVIIEHGTNDAGRPLGTNLYDPLNVNGAFGLWPAVRAALAPTSWLFHQLPFSSTDRAAILAAGAAYALVDPMFRIIDPGIDLSGGLGAGNSGLPYPNPAPSWLSFGNVHPWWPGSSKAAARVAAAISAIIAPSTGTANHSHALPRGR